jgi:hypothetical protein
MLKVLYTYMYMLHTHIQKNGTYGQCINIYRIESSSLLVSFLVSFVDCFVHPR